jgi:hypothetical protein
MSVKTTNSVEVDAFFQAIYDDDVKNVQKYIQQGIKIDKIHERKHSFSPLGFIIFFHSN